LACEALEPRNLFSFAASLNFDVGNSPDAVAVGDFNGDGIPDLAVANCYSNNVSVLLGKGDGTFQPARTFAAVGTHFVTVADLTGNGILDLVTTGSVLLGNGDGTFQPPRTFQAGSFPLSVAVGDFDGDGTPDLAVADSGLISGTPSVHVLLGNGDGTFRPGLDLFTGNAPSAVVAADFTGDGILDLAVANEYDNNVSVLLGNGDGTFVKAGNVAVGTDPVSLAVADLNGDGTPDLAVVNQGTYPHVGEGVSILLGNGDGTFQPARNIAAGPNPVAVAIADLNGDGTPDLAVANSAYYSGAATVSVLLGNGDGTFQTARDFGVGSRPAAVAIGDFNGDSIADLVVANFNSNNVSILLGLGDGTFTSAPSYSAGTNPSTVVVGDFNNDGIPDLAVGNSNNVNGTVTILQGNGDGTFGAAHSFPVGNYPGVVAVGDFNGDGNLDLIESDLGNGSGPALNLLLGNGDGTFQPPRPIAHGGAYSVAVGDFDSDGTLDLAVAPILGSTVTIYLGVGDGTFRVAGTFPIGVRPGALAVGDFNGDGIPDLVALDNGNYGENMGVTVLLGNGDGTFGHAQFSAPWYTSSFLAVGDFNGDGISDLAVAGSDVGQNPSSGVKVLLGNGDGTFGPPLIVPVQPGRVAAADFNNDGIPDLAVSHRGSVKVLLGNGDGTFQMTPVSYATGNDTSQIALGDFNGDGWTDFVTANPSANDATVFLNDRRWPTSPVRGSRPGASSRRLADAARADAALTLAGVGRAPVAETTYTVPGPLPAAAVIAPHFPNADAGFQGGIRFLSREYHSMQHHGARWASPNPDEWTMDGLAAEPWLTDDRVALWHER
jgi:hypothetical protein